MQPYVRPIVICVFRHENNIFVAEGYDSVKRDHFYRPLGGTIEFGEPAVVAVRRELLEEIGAELEDIHYLGTLESIFTVDGQPGHEIVMVFEACFADTSFYERPSLEGREDDGSTFTAYWKPMVDFEQGPGRLVPEGLLEMLTEARS